MIENLKDLEKLLKLCRKQGVTEINLGAVSFKLGEMPQTAEQVAQAAAEDASDPYANFPAGMLSPEQLMFYSSGGVPENDPELEEKPQ
jgi:hypothetical protein